MKRRVSLGFVLLLLFWPVPVMLGASKPATGWLIGRTRLEVVSAWGPPDRYFDAMAARYSKTYPTHAGGLVWDVYRRHTRTQEYEILLDYEPDFSQSRLHPSLRLEEIRFDFDKVMTAREALADIAEVKEVCDQRCTAWKSDLGMILVDPAKKRMITLSFMPLNAERSTAVQDLGSKVDQLVLSDVTEFVQTEDIIEGTTWPEIGPSP